MDEIMAWIALGFLALLTVLSYMDERLKMMAGFGWVACGLFIFVDYHLLFLFLSAGVGLYLLLTGVMDYYG